VMVFRKMEGAGPHPYMDRRIHKVR